MSSHDELRSIHLAVLPAITNKGHPVHPTIVRSVLMAIAIDTDNGRHPVRRIDLALAAGMGHHSANYMNAIIGQLAVAGLLKLETRQSRHAIGQPRTAGVSIDFATLATIARPPLAVHGVTTDPHGVASMPVPSDLLKLRDSVLEQLGIGPVYVGTEQRNARHEGRIRVRAEACRIVRARWKVRTGVRLTNAALGQLFGLDHSSIKYALKAYPNKPEPKEVAA